MSTRPLGPVLVGLSLFLALGACAGAQPRRLPPIPRTPIVARPAPKPPTPKVPKQPRPIGADVTRKFEVVVATTQARVTVTLSASTAVDERVLAYLEKTLHVVPIDPAAAKEHAAWLQHAGPARPGHDVAVALTTGDGQAVTDHAALPPDGVELVRPGILRVREQLIAGLAAKPPCPPAAAAAASSTPASATRPARPASTASARCAGGRARAASATTARSAPSPAPTAAASATRGGSAIAPSISIRRAIAAGPPTRRAASRTA